MFIYDKELNVFCDIKIEEAVRVYSGLNIWNWKLHTLGHMEFHIGE